MNHAGVLTRPAGKIIFKRARQPNERSPRVHPSAPSVVMQAARGRRATPAILADDADESVLDAGVLKTGEALRCARSLHVSTVCVACRAFFP